MCEWTPKGNLPTERSKVIKECQCERGPEVTGSFQSDIYSSLTNCNVQFVQTIKSRQTKVD